MSFANVDFWKTGETESLDYTTLSYVDFSEKWNILKSFTYS